MKKKNIGRIILISSILIFIGSLIYFGYPYLNGDVDYSSFITEWFAVERNRMNDDIIFYTNKLNLPDLSVEQKKIIGSSLEEIGYEVDWIEIDKRKKTYKGSTICYDENDDFVIISAQKKDGSTKRDVSFIYEPFPDFPGFGFPNAPFDIELCTMIYTMDYTHDIFVFKNNVLYFIKDAREMGLIEYEDYRKYSANYLSFYNFRERATNLSIGNGW